MPMDERILRVIPKDQYDKIKNLNILIVGVGGVGGSAFEALVRMGVLNFTVIDTDKFDISNLNRQVLANINNIGHFKAIEADLRAKSINPDILVESRVTFLDESNFKDIDIKRFDYVLDCCDTVNTKLLLIKECLSNNIKIISSMGTGNRIDPTKLEITNIWKTSGDPLAKKMRKLLKDNRISKKVMVVSSREVPVKVSNPVGSTSLVPNVAGYYMASYVINDVLKKGD
jgi:tRNA A37 threonylcarbamoyladenosine dehydratase